jgi:hypothetical protein
LCFQTKIRLHLQSSLYNSVSILTGYELGNRGSIPDRAGPFSSPLRPDRLWGPPSLLSSGYQVFPWGVKRLGCESDHSPQSNAEVKNAWSYIYTPPIRLYSLVQVERLCSPSGLFPSG